nr:anti-phage dCTP deaminase [Ancylobacter oerskovii]
MKKSYAPAKIAKIKNPELIIGLVGPIGVDLDLVFEQLSAQLKNVEYNSHLVKITDILTNPPFLIKIDNRSYTKRYLSLISEADRICKEYGSADFLARLSIANIREIRKGITGSYVEPALGNAYIIRQLKREAEVDLLKRVYGRKFILVSVFLNEKNRREELIKKISSYDATATNDDENVIEATELMSRDAQEENEEHGQEVSLIFHRGDVFVDGANRTAIERTISRFVSALFGHNGISPNRNEYGMYAAAGAALRSIDLSRQVGAAIFSQKGEVISLGCNEVPRAFGGTYWADDIPDSHRDFEEGIDANHFHKTVIIKDLVDRLCDSKVINSTWAKKLRNSSGFRSLINLDSIKKSKAMDIIEFGRMIHAEMSAITDAARIGRSTKDAVLFCTTFPCHMCAKHIVAAGIKKVVFLEPYPKSYAKKLHSDSITFEPSESDKKVYFEPFLGISPRRYRDIFEKSKRKDKQGKSLDWYEQYPFPRIDDSSASYIEIEDGEVLPRMFLIKKIKRKKDSVS